MDAPDGDDVLDLCDRSFVPIEESCNFPGRMLWSAKLVGCGCSVIFSRQACIFDFARTGGCLLNDAISASTKPSRVDPGCKRKNVDNSLDADSGFYVTLRIRVTLFDNP